MHSLSETRLETFLQAKRNIKTTKGGWFYKQRTQKRIFLSFLVCKVPQHTARIDLSARTIVHRKCAVNKNVSNS